MPLFVIFLGILGLLLLIGWLKLNPFISFVLVSLGVGLALGLTGVEVISSVQKGIGELLQSLVLILGFGAILGKQLADTGAAQSITQGLIQAFGKKRIRPALILTGFIIGIPMFYAVGFVILVPIIFIMAAATGLPLIFMAVPVLATLSVTHGYLPPHPAPTTVSEMINADVGLVLQYGIIIAWPAIIAATLYTRTLKSMKATPLKELTVKELLPADEIPPFSSSLAIAILPVILILLRSFADRLPLPDFLMQVIDFSGEASMALLISVLLAIPLLGLKKFSMAEISTQMVEALKSIAPVLLIIAGAGALKAVITDSGAGDYISQTVSTWPIHLLLLAWIVAAILRICIGSATVASLTTAGILLPTIAASSVQPELVVLAIGAGSLGFSHVNDGGFWLFKEYFNLSIKDTFKSWTVMETIVSIVGLIGVFVLHYL